MYTCITVTPCPSLRSLVDIHQHVHGLSRMQTKTKTHMV